jgi:hypothetical protein
MLQNDRAAFDKLRPRTIFVLAHSSVRRSLFYQLRFNAALNAARVGAPWMKA